jgi:hypothetical protein
MAVADVGSSSVFQTPGASRPPQSNPAPTGPANDDDQAQSTQAAAPEQAQNTNPSEDERKKAEAAGRTRGSFVNVQA